MSKQAAPPKPRTGRPLLDFAGAGEYLGLTERHTRRLVAEKRLPHIKLSDSRSGHVRFDPDKLDEWITSRGVDAERS
jgi:excisionase family DNA binding protein